MSSFKDHFSTQSEAYAKYRPKYPKALYDFIFEHVNGRDTAWDCATGNGQVAVALSQKFDEVIATDASANQIEHAENHPRIIYRVAPAEASGLDDRQVDLITVGQAMHWFNFEAFYLEAERVAKQDALLVIWGYAMHSITPEIDEVVNRLNENYIGAYWPEERKYVDEHYETIFFPYDSLDFPKMEMKLMIPLQMLIGYLTTWSSTQRFIQEHGYNPVEKVLPELKEAWGKPEGLKPIVWPLFAKAGYISK